MEQSEQSLLAASCLRRQVFSNVRPTGLVAGLRADARASKLTHQATDSNGWDSIRISILRSRDCQTSQACGPPTQRTGGEVHFVGICLVEIRDSVIFDPRSLTLLSLASIGHQESTEKDPMNERRLSMLQACESKEDKDGWDGSKHGKKWQDTATLGVKL